MSDTTALYSDPEQARTASLAQGGCRTCGTSQPLPGDAALGAPVYAIGRLEPRFPTIGVEKELAQAIGRQGTADLGHREAIHAVLSRPEHFYLVRQLCWVLTIESVDAYVVAANDAEDVRLLLGALRPTPREGDIDVVLGTLGPLADGRGCNGLRLPTVLLTQLYSFDIAELTGQLARPQGVSEQSFAATVQEVMRRALLLSDNMGLRDEHRAINYLVTRDPSLYAEVAEQRSRNASLYAVRTRLSALSGGRRVMEVVLEFRDRQTAAVEKRFTKVDVTEAFPFLVSRWIDYTEF